jgi:hypothetical protein
MIWANIIRIEKNKERKNKITLHVFLFLFRN